MYSLVWQSVMWRPGKVWFLIGVKNVARQTGWEGSDNQDEKPSVAAQA
jgi:hypothetical protein